MSMRDLYPDSTLCSGCGVPVEEVPDEPGTWMDIRMGQELPAGFCAVSAGGHSPGKPPQPQNTKMDQTTELRGPLVARAVASIRRPGQCE